MLVTEEQPVAAGRPGLGPLMEETAERGDTGTGTDHDDRPVGVLRDAEGVVRLQPDTGEVTVGDAVGEVGRAHAAVAAGAGFRTVTHRGHREVDPVRAGQRGRGDRVLAGLQRAQQAEQFVGGEPGRRVLLEQVEDVPAPEERVQGVTVVTADDVGETTVRGGFGDRGDEVLAGGADLTGLQDRLEQGRVLDRQVTVEVQAGEDRTDQFRIVDREDGQSIAGGVGDAGVRQIELVVVDLLRAALGGEPAGRGERGGERVLPVPLRLRRLVGGSGGRTGGAGGHAAGCTGGGVGDDRGDCGADPFGGLVLEVDVAVDPGGEPLGPELFQSDVEVLTGLAEIVVAGVTETEHGEGEVLQARHLGGVELLPEHPGVVGHLALTVGGGDDEHVARPGGQGTDTGGVEFGDVGAEAGRPQPGGELVGEFGGVAGLRAEEHVDGQCGGRALVALAAEVEAGEETVEPGLLFDGERGPGGQVEGHAEIPFISRHPATRSELAMASSTRAASIRAEFFRSWCRIQP